MAAAIIEPQTEVPKRIYAGLRSAFPDLDEAMERVVYRYNRVSIRVRVVSERFHEKSETERERMVMDALKVLSSEEIEDVTMLLMMTPEEARKPSLVDLEFLDPSRPGL